MIIIQNLIFNYFIFYSQYVVHLNLHLYLVQVTQTERKKNMIKINAHSVYVVIKN